MAHRGPWNRGCTGNIIIIIKLVFLVRKGIPKSTLGGSIEEHFFTACKCMLNKVQMDDVLKLKQT